MMDIPPNHTIYINNLNEKIQKEDLRKSLYAIFSQFGPVLDIVAMKTPRMRGQAFIVFREITMATNALRSMQGFPFFDKPMRIAYAKSKSDFFSKKDGTYWSKGKDKRRAEEMKRKQPSKIARKEPSSQNDDETTAKPVKTTPVTTTTTTTTTNNTDEEEATNKILFLSNLPDETTDMMLSMLFQQFDGFKDVRLVDGRSDIGFVEFEVPTQAQVAKDQLNGFKITPTNSMVINYAKQ